MEEIIKEKYIVIKNEKNNTFCGRYASTGSDFKIRYNTLEELKKEIDIVIQGAKHLDLAKNNVW